MRKPRAPTAERVALQQIYSDVSPERWITIQSALTGTGIRVSQRRKNGAN